MMEVDRYKRKITPYLDGSMSDSERSEFEAYVSTHPEFQDVILSKQEELDVLMRMIPTVTLPYDLRHSLSREIEESAFNLLRSEPKNLWDSIKQSVQDLLRR